MTFVRIDDGAPDHPHVMGLSDSAWSMWAKGLCYCTRYATDGIVPREALCGLTTDRRPVAVAKQLVAAGLWTEHQNGYAVRPSRMWSVEGTDRWSDAAYPEVYSRDGEVCRYCGATEILSIDHVIPRCQGGGDGAANLVVACRSCNSRKNGRTPEQAGMVLR